jgi:hypothetical protein
METYVKIRGVIRNLTRFDLSTREFTREFTRELLPVGIP